MEIINKTFIISGGDSGLGKACVHHLLKLGANIVIADLKESEKVPKTLFIKTDVTKEESAENLMQESIRKFGTINGLINCAGIGTPERVLSKEGVPSSLKNFSKTIQVNLIGTFNLIRCVSAILMKNPPDENKEQGVIINTASIAAFEGQIGQAAYSASKGGIVSMTLPLAREFSKFGVRVLTIAPGIFDTPMLQGLSDEVRASLEAQVPFPSRLGDPHEFAFLCEQVIRNPMLNGTTIRLDGAIRMQPR